MHRFKFQILERIKQCSKLRLSIQGKSLHAYVIKTGLDEHLPLYPNALIDMYGKNGHLKDAVKLFDEMPDRDLVSWASIFTAHNQANFPRQTLFLFSCMLSRDGLQPDHFIFASLVKACACLSASKLGQQLHTQFVLSRFSDDDVVKSSLVDFYAKCGLPDQASKVFYSIVSKNVVSWTSLVYGYARIGRKNEALELLHDMPCKNVHSWTALISGFVQGGHCTESFRLFNQLRSEGIDIEEPFVLSSLIVGSSSLAIDVLSAEKIFDSLRERDVVSWTSIIVGMAQHGRANEALSLYDDMTKAGSRPNEVTFTGLIYACSHVGLVDKGRQIFESMVGDYGLSPSLQHYTCLVDLYSRAGHIEEAENVLNTMPFEPDEAAWAALLSACSSQAGKNETGVRIANHLLQLGVEDPSTCVLMSKIYASATMWESVSTVRRLMTAMESKKKPGYSCVDLGKENEVFYAGETMLHPMRNEIVDLLKELDSEMRKRGYKPDTSLVLHDMGEEEKERRLFWHSERLAVAYGLLKSARGAPIRIIKNLRVCGDCHTVLKLVCSIVGREIVVRDANRFHRFKDGACSCRDFW
ncbi:hypothetical protein MIMGU_mgv1a003506mg [Erythranthe guttata]|uniref:DYW domain-containing protein n=1 Tax=Erythranthe guttata TaxID=4155 RepID=A0A022RDH8_ERYGU|nr:hypothetical protein MIMGU_mgv1a003506mg [Erythranthe guttata]